MFEYYDITTKKHENFIIYVYEGKEADNYEYINIAHNKFVGVFIDKNNEVIGINTYSSADFYSPKKLKEIAEHKVTAKQTLYMVTIEEAGNHWIDWWNKECYSSIEMNPNPYDDITVKIKDLSKYFIETIEKNDNSEFDVKTWYTYYINPPCGLSVKINDVEVDYTGQKIKQITLFESEIDKVISFHDNNDYWLEDIDVRTTKNWDDISLVFEREDLETCSTTNEEQQVYVELYEKINPYNSLEENREAFKEWFDNNQKWIK